MTTLEETINKTIEVAVKKAMLASHPIGSYYISDDNTNPAEILGGYGNNSTERFFGLEM